MDWHPEQQVAISTLLKKRKIPDGPLSPEDEDWLLLGHLKADYKRVKKDLVSIR